MDIEQAIVFLTKWRNAYAKRLLDPAANHPVRHRLNYEMRDAYDNCLKVIEHLQKP
jgi:hypothetical protein